MANDYGELMELGFEGVDRFAKRFHDPCHDFIDKKRPHWHNRKGKEINEKHQHQHPHQHQTRPEPAEDQNRVRPYHDKLNGEMHVSDTDLSDTDLSDTDRRRDRDWGDDGGRDDRYGGARERGFNDAQSGPAVLRGHDAIAYSGGYQVAAPPHAPCSAQFTHARRHFGTSYGDKRVYETRRPLPPRHRKSSYSSAVRLELHRNCSTPRQRQRSQSPHHHLVAATLVGALAGGIIGNTASYKSHGWAAVAGAVVGGLGGREVQKVYDRRNARGIDEPERREQRRRV